MLTREMHEPSLFIKKFHVTRNFHVKYRVRNGEKKGQVRLYFYYTSRLGLILKTWLYVDFMLLVLEISIFNSYNKILVFSTFQFFILSIYGFWNGKQFLLFL